VEHFTETTGKIQPSLVVKRVFRPAAKSALDHETVFPSSQPPFTTFLPLYSTIWSFISGSDILSRENSRNFKQIPKLTKNAQYNYIWIKKRIMHHIEYIESIKGIPAAGPEAPVTVDVVV
jgi:hypothetical protein